MDTSESRMARALWLESANICRLRDAPLAAPGREDVIVAAAFSGISRGTEALVFHGKVPPGEYERMRAPHQAGDFPFPVKYGYCSVGHVEAGPAAMLGRPVFCLHPHQDRYVVATDSVALLPAGLPVERAVLAANMETALNIVWDAGILPGDRVAVFGAGVVGCLAAFLANGIAGTDTVLCDINAGRATIAQALGLTFRDPDGVPGDCDVLINASASPSALASAIGHAGTEARIVEASWYGDRQVALPLGGAFHARRLSIVSSQVGTIPHAQRSRWTYARRMAKALDLLTDDRLDALISGESLFHDLENDYPRILADADTLCHRIRYR